MRSLILVDAADCGALENALAAAPDGVVLNLGRAPHVLPPQRSVSTKCRRDLAEWLVQVGPLGSDDATDELEAAMAWAPGGILLRGAVGARDIQRLGAMLAVAEAIHDRPDGGTTIFAAPADTPAGSLAVASLQGTSPRLRGLLWDGECLARALGCAVGAAPIGHARSALVLAAAAAGIPAYASLGASGAAALIASARQDGFAGFLACDAVTVGAARRALELGLRPASGA